MCKCLFQRILYVTVISTDPDTGEMDRKRRLDSDSDSDLSAMGNPDLDLASSHSSDDDDDDDNFAWDAVNPQPQQSECHNMELFFFLTFLKFYFTIIFFLSSFFLS